MAKTPEQKLEGDVMRRLMKMPPEPFTPKGKKKPSPSRDKAKKT